MAHYLVTGAAGFIASRVSEMLLDNGHIVTGLDNLNDAYDVRMKEYRLARLRRRAGFHFHHLDISSRSQVEDLAAGPAEPFAAVINLAARAGVRQSVENPWVYVDTNVTGTLNLLELCHRLEVPKFIIASTSSIYGDKAPLPTPETFDSDHPLQAYAASKKGAEALCHAYHHLYGLDVSVLRFFTVYGPAGRPDMVMFRFAQWIAEERPVYINGSGEQTRGFTYLDDIARGVILGLKPLGYQVINLGGHQTISINDLLRLFEEHLGKKALVQYLPPNPADMQSNWADVTKAGQLLDWESQVTLADGVKNLVDWYLAERSWASQIQTV